MTPTPTWRALADRLAAALTVCCRCQIRHGVVVEKCTPCKRLDEYRAACAAEAIVQTPEVAARMSAVTPTRADTGPEACAGFLLSQCHKEKPPYEPRDGHAVVEISVDQAREIAGYLLKGKDGE